MAKENYSNFATTQLVTSSLSPSSTTFIVTSGQGALFPLSNFTLTMDTEVMLISSRSGDTFVVGTRGFDNTAATSHTVGATIQLCVTAYTLNHLWQNVADTFSADVPPGQVSGTPSSVDHEFESGVTSSWQLFPNSGLPSGAIFSMGSSLKSHLLLKRGTSDNTLYTAYVPFTQSSSWMVTCKLSHAVSLANSNSVAEVHFFVSDQTNPSASPDSGNRVRLDSIIDTSVQSGTWHSWPVLVSTVSIVRMLKDVSGVGTQVGNAVPVSPALPLYLRIACASGGNYTCLVGDGLTYWAIASFQSSFSVQTLGFQFYANPNATATVSQTAAIDWIRVSTLSTNASYGA